MTQNNPYPVDSTTRMCCGGIGGHTLACRTLEADNDAGSWRDLADQLTPEQIARFEHQEAQALNSIAQGRNVYENADDITRCFLTEARLDAEGNRRAAEFGVPMPSGADAVEHWGHAPDFGWTRLVHGPAHTLDGHDATVYSTGVQTHDGSVAWSLYVHVDDRQGLTPAQVRGLAAKLLDAADEFERTDA